MHTESLCFSIVRQAAWMPGVETAQDWQEWAAAVPAGVPHQFADSAEPVVARMPAMLRRRAGQLGKMALEVAYACLDEQRQTPIVFCSRHGEVQRSLELLSNLARGEALSPTAFGMAVHNASAGLFSIARADQASQLALAAGAASVEAALIEACSLLADGEPQVLLLFADSPLPPAFASFKDEPDIPHAFAWLLQAGTASPGDISLSWSARPSPEVASAAGLPASLAVLRFVLGAERCHEHVANRQRWCWSRHA